MLAFTCFALPAFGGETRVAVAANFAPTMKSLAVAFAAETGHRAEIVAGATGKLYAQISQGAPFDVLLAADAKTPARLEREGRAVAGSRFTYALGRLALWSPRAAYVDAAGAVLQSDFKRLAIANAKLAPYGEAALETLTALGLKEKLEKRFVVGESVAQAFQFVASGNAEIGFVALSQIASSGQVTRGSAWIVPAELYAPIRQDAVLLQHGHGNAAATALLDYLRGEKARALIAAHGYAL